MKKHKHLCNWCIQSGNVDFATDSSPAFAAHLFVEHPERMTEAKAEKYDKILTLAS